MDIQRTAFAKNLKELRINKKMTQAQLAEVFKYSDKAVSKWERAESIPDFSTVQAIASYFGVTVEFMITEHSEKKDEVTNKGSKTSWFNKNSKLAITAMCALLVWLIALIVFVILFTVLTDNRLWIIFVYALVASFIVILVFNSVWLNPRNNYWIISALMWSILASVYFSVLLFVPSNVWLIFTLGVPGQFIIILWSKIKQV